MLAGEKSSAICPVVSRQPFVSRIMPLKGMGKPYTGRILRFLLKAAFP